MCPEFSPTDATAWIEAGHIPELARAASVSLVDIDTGHSPIVTQPATLARILDEAAQSR